MSDGPYRSLPINGKWKKVAKLAENHAYTDEEVGAAVEKALPSELPRRFLAMIRQLYSSGLQQELCPGVDRKKLERLAGGYPLAQDLVDNLFNGSGYNGDFNTVLADTLSERCLSYELQFEEHYLRNNGHRYGIRDRMQRVRSHLNFHALASEILASDSCKKASPKRKEGIEDGPSL